MLFNNNTSTSSGEPTRWLEFLNTAWPNDPDSIALLQEWIGYALSEQTGQMLMIVGPPRCGKSTIGRVMRKLVGAAGNVAVVPLSSFGDSFGLNPNQAGKKKPLMILTNEIPDEWAAEPIARRTLILQITESYLGREDHNLDRKLDAELPAIRSWALQGLSRLNATGGRFTVPTSGLTLKSSAAQ